MIRAFQGPVLAVFAAMILSACATSISTVTGNATAPGRPSADKSTSALAFAPLSGPPPAVADALARSFANAAVARNLTLAPYQRRNSAYVIKGFISITRGEDSATAVYVWDVLDPDLKRLHRISGQATNKTIGGATAAEPWNALSQQTLDTIAGATLDQLAQWMASL